MVNRQNVTWIMGETLCAIETCGMGLGERVIAIAGILICRNCHNVALRQEPPYASLEEVRLFRAKLTKRPWRPPTTHSPSNTSGPSNVTQRASKRLPRQRQRLQRHDDSLRRPDDQWRALPHPEEMQVSAHCLRMLTRAYIDI